MEQTIKTIAAVQGADGSVAQAIFQQLIGRWARTYRIAGVVEEGYGLPDRMRGAGHLRSIADGSRYPLFQNLGSGASCQVDATGATSACSAVQNDIAAGCDLVVLSKFGRLESERRGLIPALFAAIDHAVPVLIYVPAKFEASWQQIAEPLYMVVPPDLDTIEAWWRDVRPASTAAPDRAT